MSERMQGCVAVHRRNSRAWLLLAGWAWLWLPVAVCAADGLFTVRDARAELRDEVYLLDADIEFRFSEASLEALQNGIPLVLEVEIKVERLRDWLWPESVASLSQRHRLQYHALSDRYVVHNLNTDQRQSFARLENALRTLGTLREFPMLDRRLLEDDARYRVKLRAGLVVEELPTPIRLWAYASEQWRLGSDWYTWPLQP
jgi:hypothetical protein